MDDWPPVEDKHVTGHGDGADRNRHMGGHEHTVDSEAIKRADDTMIAVARLRGL